MVSQNEDDIWTVHTPVPADLDISTLDPKETLFSTVGGGPDHGPKRLPFEIDEILVTGRWQPGSFIMEDYQSSGGRIFLAGDAAHQRPPAGGLVATCAKFVRNVS